MFSQWQPEYAKHGIATILVSLEKKPLVRHPQKFGLRGSAMLTDKFGDASMFGFYAGYRNKLTVLDIDTADETVLIDALDRHGHTPVVTKSGSGKFHAWYKHNGERRRIRPWKAEGLLIDLLGTGGLIVVPPSVAPKGQYQFIQGDLDDITYFARQVPQTGFPDPASRFAFRVVPAIHLDRPGRSR
jgi:Bifunctional DNA primase/polymerase, N-terminal